MQMTSSKPHTYSQRSDARHAKQTHTRTHTRRPKITKRRLRRARTGSKNSTKEPADAPAAMLAHSGSRPNRCRQPHNTALYVAENPPKNRPSRNASTRYTKCCSQGQTRHPGVPHVVKRAPTQERRRVSKFQPLCSHSRTFSSNSDCIDVSAFGLDCSSRKTRMRIDTPTQLRRRHTAGEVCRCMGMDTKAPPVHAPSCLPGHSASPSPARTLLASKKFLTNVRKTLEAQEPSCLHKPWQPWWLS